MTKAVFKFNFDCGRQGNLEGLFISTKEEVRALIDSEIEVYFGEVLGKHSEIYGKIGESEIILVSDDENVVEFVEKHDMENGYNPFDYWTLDEDDEDMEVSEYIKKYLNKEL